MSTDDRRFFIQEVPDTRKGDMPYWDALAAKLDGHGPSAMLGELVYDRNITYFDPRQIPDTPAGRKQRRLSLSTVQQYLMASLDRGAVYQPEHRVPSMLRWPTFVTQELFWNGYMQWCDQTHRQQRQSRDELYSGLDKLFQGGRPREWHPTHELKRGISARAGMMIRIRTGCT
jgi:hypothetical protein